MGLQQRAAATAQRGEGEALESRRRGPIHVVVRSDHARVTPIPSPIRAHIAAPPIAVADVQ